jgi:hypothetical protein
MLALALDPGGFAPCCCCCFAVGPEPAGGRAKPKLSFNPARWSTDADADRTSDAEVGVEVACCNDALASDGLWRWLAARCMLRSC